MPVWKRCSAPALAEVVGVWKKRSLATQAAPGGIAGEVCVADITDVASLVAELHNLGPAPRPRRPGGASGGILLDAGEPEPGNAEFHRTQLLPARVSHGIDVICERDAFPAFYQDLPPHRDQDLFKFHRCAMLARRAPQCPRERGLNLFSSPVIQMN